MLNFVTLIFHSFGALLSALRPILVEIFNKIKIKATDGSSMHAEQGLIIMQRPLLEFKLIFSV